MLDRIGVLTYFCITKPGIKGSLLNGDNSPARSQVKAREPLSRRKVLRKDSAANKQEDTSKGNTTQGVKPMQVCSKKTGLRSLHHGKQRVKPKHRQKYRSNGRKQSLCLRTCQNNSNLASGKNYGSYQMEWEVDRPEQLPIRVLWPLIIKLPKFRIDSLPNIPIFAGCNFQPHLFVAETIEGSDNNKEIF